MQVRVIESFDIYKKGGVFDWPAPVVKLLKARGLVEDYEEPKPSAKPAPKPKAEQKPAKQEVRVEVADEPEAAAETEKASITINPRRRK